MDDRDPSSPHAAPVKPAYPGGIQPATEDVIPPPDDDQLHSDLGLVSGGAGEEGNARAHQDG